MINKAKEYWYEIELNDNQTVVGYDEEGAKKLMLYPEGAKKLMLYPEGVEADDTK